MNLTQYVKNSVVMFRNIIARLTAVMCRNIILKLSADKDQNTTMYMNKDAVNVITQNNAVYTNPTLRLKDHVWIAHLRAHNLHAHALSPVHVLLMER
ncbi:MAG: hypothetical protein Tsb0021_07130 [Chlamydiales bacterium]